MNKFLVYISICILFASCDQEIIRLKGNFKDASDFNSQLVVKVKSLHSLKERILDTININKGKFEFYSKAIKPPVKLTFTTADSRDFDIWVGEYGLKTIEGQIHSKIECKVMGSFFCDELQRMNLSYDKMYILPINEKKNEAEELTELSKKQDLSDENYLRLEKLNKAIKTAYKLRKKSILKTARKNTQNPVAIALMCQEFERLTSHQKKECFKYLSESFGDSGLNWQMRN